MTQETAQGPNGNTTNEQASANMPPLMMGAQYIKDLSFENPDILEHLSAQKSMPEVGVNINVDAKPLNDNGAFEVVLKIETKAHLEGKDVFLVELKYGGVFTVNPDFPKESLKPLLLVECPRLLFPFARAVVANITRDGALPPLVLHPVDFAELFRQQHQETKEGASPSDQGPAQAN